MTTTWTIAQLDRELADGYVNTVHYRVDATDGTYKSRATGKVNLERPETLIPFKDLTHETVIGWVKAEVEAQAKAGNGPTVAQVEATLEAQINEQKTPTTLTGNPWE